MAGTGAARHRARALPPVEVTNRWAVAAAGDEGIDETELAGAETYAEQQISNLTALVVARHGRIVLEEYYRGGAPDRPSALYSVTKSFISALVGIALRKGMLRDLDMRVVSFLGTDLPEDADARISQITLRDLLTLRAGFELSGPQALADVVSGGGDLMLAILGRPMAADPGSVFAYDNGAAHLVSAILTQATGMPASTFARQELFRPLGIDEDASWAADRQGNSNGAFGLHLTAHDAARLGQLYLRGGRWARRQLLPRWYVRESTRKHVTVGEGGGGYGYLWWTNSGGDGIPGLFTAGGYGGQFIAVVPKLDLVVATISDASAPRGPEYAKLFRRIVMAVRDR